MRIAYLDCFSGISGDMFLGALVDAGVPFELFQQTVEALDVGATLEMSRVDRNGISATKIDVVVAGEKDLPREEFWTAHTEAAHHSHTPGESSGEQATAGGAEHSQPHGRRLREILNIVNKARISERAKHKAGLIFTALGQAEARVHNADVECLHFHEVGAVDAIVDIVCAAAGSESLQVERVLASPLNVGGGSVKCAHGTMPVPVPATLELLRGIPVYSGEVQKELVTPTGAAIVRVLAAGFGPLPAMRTERIGYGAGGRNFAGHANVLRLLVGETLETYDSDARLLDAAIEEQVMVLEANLDDLNPQIIGYTTERLLAEGALDVFTTAVQMKKGRPGTLVTVLCKISDEAKLRDILFQESSTLGVRSRREQRRILARRHESVATQWGEVRIKVGSVNGTEFQAAPEYEDCRAIAAAQNVPLKTVMQEALRVYLDKKNG